MLKFIVPSLLALTTLPAFAQEDALYGAPPPADAVFIRSLVECSSSQTLFGRDFSADELPLNTFNAISASLLDGAEEGSHYSLAACDAAPILEPAREDAAKVYLILVNADADAAKLILSGREVTVIDETVAGTAAARAVNPVQATLRVEAGDLSEEFDVSLSRGQDVTFALIDGEATLIESRFGTVIEG